jgi:hypothetical protein
MSGLGNSKGTRADHEDAHDHTQQQKTRGRPKKGTVKQSTAPSAPPPPPPVGTRSSKRKAAEVESAASDTKQIHTENHHDASPPPVGTRSGKRKAAEVEAGSSVISALESEDLYGVSPPRPKKRRSLSPPLPDTLAPRASTRGKKRPAADEDSEAANPEPELQPPPKKRLRLINNHPTPLSSIETSAFHGQADLPPASTNGDSFAIPQSRAESASSTSRLATRSGSRLDSAVESPPAGDATGTDADESVSMVAFSHTSGSRGGRGGRGRGRGRGGRIPALSRQNSGTPAFKAPPKKKGFAGKRKQSANQTLQAAYDRQLHLRSHYKALARLVRGATVSLADRNLDQIQEDPNLYKKQPEFKAVSEGLDARRTEVVARIERENQIKRNQLEKTFFQNVDLTWRRSFFEVAEIKEKYLLKIKETILDLVAQARLAEDDDDASSVVEDDSPVLPPIFQETELGVPVSVIKGKAAATAAAVVTSKKPRAEDGAVAGPVGKRLSMLSAATVADGPEDSDSAEALLTQVTPGPSRLASPEPETDLAAATIAAKADEFGIFIPNKTRRGRAREDPNNRAVVKPWFEFQAHEIGLRSLEREESGKVKPIPKSYVYLDQYRAGFDLPSGTEADFDQRLVSRHGLHPRMGLPLPISINPDNVEVRTDFTKCLKKSEPLTYVGKEGELDYTSRSWRFVTVDDRWAQMERQMDLGQGPVWGPAPKGLATYDARSREEDSVSDTIAELLDAAALVAAQKVVDAANAELSPKIVPVMKPPTSTPTTRSTAQKEKLRAPRDSVSSPASAYEEAQAEARRAFYKMASHFNGLDALADVAEAISHEAARHSPAPAQFVHHPGIETGYLHQPQQQMRPQPPQLPMHHQQMAGQPMSPQTHMSPAAHMSPHSHMTQMSPQPQMHQQQMAPRHNNFFSTTLQSLAPQPGPLPGMMHGPPPPAGVFHHNGSPMGYGGMAPPPLPIQRNLPQPILPAPGPAYGHRTGLRDILPRPQQQQGQQQLPNPYHQPPHPYGHHAPPPPYPPGGFYGPRQ